MWYRSGSNAVDCSSRGVAQMYLLILCCIHHSNDLQCFSTSRTTPNNCLFPLERIWTIYDTIRYDIDLRALKSWRDGQLNLAHGPETKNNEKKIKIKNRVAQKKRCRQKSVEAVREEEVKLRGVGFVKEVGFKPGVKERWSYRCTKWWIRRESDGWRNRWAGYGGTGARMRFTKTERKLIPETRWSITEGAISYF